MCNQISGNIELDINSLIKINSKKQKLESEIDRLSKKIKTTKQFNQKVELNIELEKLKKNMINSANARTISELFNPDKDITYFIPKYQREYVWGKSNWELLFDDILANEEDHFLGSIICINTKVDSQENDKLELIDGQQRMTTLNIFFLALYQHIEKFKTKIEDEEELNEFNSELLNLKYKLILKSDKKTLRLEPSLSGNNKQDFEHLFSKETKLLRK